jgi:hypothetical protein
MASRLPGDAPEPIGTTPRKNLTPLQRLALLEAWDHRCALCGKTIGLHEKWRDEHLRALGLGGTNDTDKRGPVHILCAEAKDVVDLAAIRKAKRQKAIHVGAHEPSGKWPARSKPEKHRRAPAPSQAEIGRRYKPMKKG